MFRTLLTAGVAVGILAGCATTGPRGEDDFHVSDGLLHRGKDDVTMKAIYVAGVGEKGGGKEDWLPAYNRVAEVGCNTLCIDLWGFNADGTEIDPAAITAMQAMAKRVDTQRMGTIVRATGTFTDPVKRRNAVETVAKTLRKEGRFVYLIDGDDAAELTAILKEKAPQLVVLSPSGGDLRLVADVKSCENLPHVPMEEASVVDPLIVADGFVPDPAVCLPHLFLRGSEEDFAALDTALMNPAETAAYTPDNAMLTQEEIDAGFVSLFNNEDLVNWWYSGDNTNGFQVSPCGFVEWKEKGGGAIMSAKRYGDFILRLDYRIVEGGNSGIFLRAPRASRQSYIGMEFQIHGDMGVEPNDDGTGALYLQHPPLANPSKGSLEWNAIEIKLEGSKINATLNGEVIHDYDLEEHDDLRHRLRRGFIGLQDHGDYVSFRNVRIKEL